MESMPEEQGADEVRQVRTLFMSDVHLGMRPTRIAQCVDYLKHHDAETIYLIGDILDGWRLAKAWYWPPIYNEFVEVLLDKAARGTRMVVVPGNHDEFLREYLGTYFGEVEFVVRTVHTTALGRTYLVMHGDQFDVVVAHAKWLAHVGDWAYRTALRLNIFVNWVRRRLRRPYWSLRAWAKNKVKNVESVIGRVEEAPTVEARDTGVDGAICGHIHFADMHERLGIHYINTGDWVESCTAVCETAEGQFELIKWDKQTPVPLKVKRAGILRRAKTTTDTLSP